MSKRRRFGKIRKLQSGRCSASYIDPRTGTRIFADHTFRTKTDAERWLVKIEADLHRNDLVDAKLEKITFQEWAEQWLATRRIKVTTESRYEVAINSHLVPYFGKMRLGSITRTDVTKFLKLMTETMANSTIDGIRQVFSSIMLEAARSNAIRRNPADGVSVKRTKREEMIFLTRDQIAVLSAAISVRPMKRRGGYIELIGCPEYGLLVRLTTETGLRAGEIAALRVGRIDIHNRRLLVAESVAEVSLKKAPKGLVYSEPKTYERRSVPLPAGLAEDLEQYLKARPSDPKAFVFVSPQGKPMRHSNFFDRIYKPAVLRAGLDPSTRFHDLRHTYAALLIAAGANALTVKQRMGHSSITVTMDRYGHLFPHLEEAITDLMDQGYREAHRKVS